MNEDERAIRDLVAQWLSASAAGDTGTVLTLMTDDVVFMVPGHAPFGKEAFAAASKSMSNIRMEGTSDIVELKILNNWAWMRNRLRVSATPPDGRTIVRSGFTLTILRKNAEGRWQIARDANLLAVEPAPAG